MKREALDLIEAHPRALASFRALMAVVNSPARARRSWQVRAALRTAGYLAPQAVARVVSDEHPATWQSSVVLSSGWSGTGAAIIKMGPPGRAPAMVVKMTTAASRKAGLSRSAQMLVALRSESRLGRWRDLLPIPIGVGEIGGQSFSVETALPGVPAGSLLADRRQYQSAVADAALLVTELHRRTRHRIEVDDATLDAWIASPARVVADACRDASAVTRLVRTLTGACEGRSALVGWIHGDFWPGNLLVSPDDGRITGVVDWERSSPADLPHHDLFHLLVYARMSASHCEVGDVVAFVLGGGAWDADELAILDAAEIADVGVGGQANIPLMLFWLRHVSLTLLQSPQRAKDWVWMTRNVERVLRVL